MTFKKKYDIIKLDLKYIFYNFQIKKEVKQKLAITENSFDKAEKITSSDFNDLKQLIDVEVNS